MRLLILRHWLKAMERIEFKLAVLVYICLHQTSPLYLADEFHQFSEGQDPSASPLRFVAIACRTVVRRTRLSTIGDQAFPVVA